jgi:hypothetical protein
MKSHSMRLMAIVFGMIITAGIALGTPAHFTDISQNQGSGLNDDDFSAGTAVFDFNNDGFDDIVVNNYYTPNRLYRSNGNGTFTDVGGPAGVSQGPHTLGIATGDLDASGYLDFLVFAEAQNIGFLYMNDGDGTFTNAAPDEFSISGGYYYDGYACSFADYDRDGLLDVFYAGRLFHNQGNTQFEEVTAAVGLGNLSFVAHASFADIDNDNDPDLFIARQGGPAALFINNGTGYFTQVTNGLEPDLYGLCGIFGDVDNDGDLDLFVSLSNRMYLNDGTGRFTRNYKANTYSRYTRGAVFADFDNDGDPDLVLANEDGSSTFHENTGGGNFADRTAEVGMNNGQEKAGGVAAGDFDYDGDLDLYIPKTDNLVNPCFINSLNNHNAIEVIPRGTVSNYSGIGARVYLYRAGHKGDMNYLVGMAELASTSGFHAGTNGRVHLGTGTAGTFDVRVVFPSGNVSDMTGVSSGSRVAIWESGTAPTYVRLSPASTTIVSDINGSSSVVNVAITDSKGEGISWTASESSPWITLQNTSGVTPGTLTFVVDPAGMGIGQYSGEVVITAAEAANSPVKYRVTLQVTNYFLTNVSSVTGLTHYDFTNGAAFFDYDRDGFDDIFASNQYGQSRLYHSNGTVFTDEAVAAGVAAAYHNLGLFGGDLNGDDWPDLLTFTEDRTVGFTYMNTGAGNFIDAGIGVFSTTQGYDGYAVNAADIDNDGDLDVFYGARLFRNDGSMGFTDITAAAGLSNIRFVCRALFGDIDGDNDMDLFINRQNCAVSLLFRNDGTGHFTDISGNSSLGYFPTGLGASFGDVDNDGDLDMYTGAGYSYPNFLFLNDGSGYFVDITDESGTSCTNYTRGTELFDVDNDGDLDLVVANENRSAQLFINDGTAHFMDATESSGINDGLAKAGPAVVGDYDADGDLDIYIGRTDNLQNSFFRNATNNGKFIKVTPVGVMSNRTGIGAKLYLYPAGQLGNDEVLFAFREYNISNGFSGSGPNYVHFGTGAVDLFDLRVMFPSGAVVDQYGITPGSELTVIESGEVPDFLVLVPGNFNFEFSEGQAAQNSQLMIKNRAGDPIPWTASVNAAWCRLSVSAGTTDQTITVTADPVGIAPGTYEAAITVTAPDAVNSPRTAVVRMTVKSNKPVLALSTSTLNFTAEQGGNDPWNQAFTVRNAGPGALTWTLQTSGATWLEVYPTSGTAPTDVNVICHTGGMKAGMYHATVAVMAPGALNSPAVLTVNFEVLPGAVPERDTVSVASGIAQPGDHIAVPVYLHNIHDVAAFTVPLKFDPDVLTCDSVSYVETRVDYLAVKESRIDTAAGQVLFGVVVLMEANLPIGDGEIARLYFTVNPNAEEQVTVIDTAFFPPAGEFSIFDPSSASIVPEFIQSRIFVSLDMYGDANGSGDINLADAVYLVNYVFKGCRPPIPVESGDANRDNSVNVGDVVCIINFVFRGGSGPGATAKQSAPTDPVYYTVEQVATKDGTELQLNLDGDVPLGGVQFEIPDPAGFLQLSSPKTGELAVGMEVHQGHSDEMYRFGILDMTGTRAVDPGAGLLFRVRYSGYEGVQVNSFRAFDRNGAEIPTKYGVRQRPPAIPTEFDLAQNYPNPFNPATTIKYATSKPGQVQLAIFNVLGQQVRELVNDVLPAGYHTVVWDGTNNAGETVATGIYFYRLKTEDFVQTKKMALIK